MRKSVLWILIGIVALGLIVRFGYQPISQILGLAPHSGIRVEANIPARVFLNGKEVGNTPYQDEKLSAGEYLVEVKGQSSANEASGSAKPADLNWKRQVKLNPGTLTVVHRELGADGSSSGEVITLEKGQGVTIISTPSEAEVSVNGQTKGLSPIHIADVQPGEQQFIISKDNFLKRSVQATLVDGFNLTLNVDLASTIGNQSASASSTPAPTPSPSSSATPVASASPSPSSAATSQVVVSGTPNGFLRVRQSASTSAAEIGRVNEGDTLTVIENQSTWLKVKLSNGTIGYVSAAYTKKKGS